MSDLPSSLGCSICPGVVADANNPLLGSHAPPNSCGGADAARVQGCASAASADCKQAEYPGASTSDITCGAAKGLRGAAMQPLPVDHAASELAHVLDSPRLVIRGESHSSDIGGSGLNDVSIQPPVLAFLDWLSFTVVPPSGESLSWLYPQLVEWLGFYGLNQRRNGLFGYEKSFDADGHGLVAYGGRHQHGTIFVSLNASGCARVPDWLRLREWFEAVKPVITRVDLAHDDFEGRKVTIEAVRAWYQAGGFTNSGRPPSILIHGDWDNLREGRTVYIGKRIHGKLLRAYEKGKQLGNPNSSWVRVELELRRKNREIPYDVLITPSPYLAGAFPCLGYLSDHQERIKTIHKSNDISLEASIQNGRLVLGKLINVLLHICGGDAGAVVALLIREGVPRRLATYANYLFPEPGKDHENT